MKILLFKSLTLVALSNLMMLINSSLGGVVTWGDHTYQLPPIPPGLNNVVAISCGNHNLAIQNGKVHAWGDNFYGQCNVPVGLSGVTAIAAGDYHSLALKNDGTVWAFGHNGNGQCDTAAPFSPGYRGQVLHPALPEIVAIAAGEEHSLAVTKVGGNVIAWGKNTVYNNVQHGGQTEVPIGLSGVIAVAAGAAHSLALTAPDGKIHAWGYNGDGQTTIPPELQSGGVQAIAAGAYHSMALKDGKVYAWGQGAYGQTAVPADLKKVIAIAAGDGFGFSLALQEDGTIRGWGNNSHAEIPPPPGLDHVVAIAAGMTHSLAIVRTCSPTSGPPCADSITAKLLLWLKADAGVDKDASSAVIHWNDQSVYGNDFIQNDPIKRPIWKTSGIHFDGNGWLTCGPARVAVGVGAPGPSLSPHTIIVYVRPTNVPSNLPSAPWASPCKDGDPLNPGPLHNCQWNLGLATDGRTFNRYNASATIVGAQTFQMTSGLGVTANNSEADPLYVCFNETPPGTTPPGTKYLTLLASENHRLSINSGAHMIAVTDDVGLNENLNNTINLYVDDYAPKSPSVPPPQIKLSRQITCIGGGVGALKVDGNNQLIVDYTEAANLFTGDIYEVLVYSEPLTQSQIHCIYTYLACKWGQ